MKRLFAILIAAALVGSTAVAQTTITIAAGAVGIELELARAAAARYMEAHPDVTVNVLETPDLADSRLGVYLQLFEAQSSEVDVFQIDVIWPGDLAEHFVDLYEYGARDVVDEHFPAIIANNTVDGKLIGIPWFTDAGLLYYRTDLLEKYGFSGPPTTWDEFLDVARALKAQAVDAAPDHDVAVLQGMLLDELAGYGNINVISQADGTVDVEMGGKLVINQGECDALTMSKDQKGYVDVDWRSSGKSVSLTSGSLLGYINVLNGRGNNAQSNKETPVQGIPYYRDRINTFAAALVKVANTSIPENDGNGNPKVGADGKIEYKILLSAKKGDGTTDSSLPITAGNIAISDEWNLNGPGYFIFSRAENVENYAQKLSARLTGESNTFTSYGESFQGNFSDYIIDVVGKVGTDVSFNEGRRDAAATVSDDFLSQREAVSGVQQDEETADMLKYQRSF